MEKTVISNPRTIIMIGVTLVIGLLGGYFFGVSNLQPTINELKENNLELSDNITNLQIMNTDLQNNLTSKKNELIKAQEDINVLKEDIEIYNKDVIMLQEEIDRITALYQQIDIDYKELYDDYQNLTLQSNYELNKIFLREDFSISYSYPTRIYTSPDFNINSITTKFEYNLWSDQRTSSSSVQLRIYRSGTPIRVYTEPIRMKEEPEFELYHAEGSYSVVLDDGSYYLTLVIDDGSLSPSPVFQSSLHIWDYY